MLSFPDGRKNRSHRLSRWLLFDLSLAVYRLKDSTGKQKLKGERVDGGSSLFASKREAEKPRFLP